MEVAKRLVPSPEVTRRLYLASGNRCAHPNCEHVLMLPNGVLVGEIAHIEGALPDSARFNPAMSNEQRRGYANLVLLCATCHLKIDRDPATWTVDKLTDLKRRHEAIYTAAIESLRRRVGDVTEGVSFIPAANLMRILDWPTDGSERVENCNVVNQFASRLTSIPEEARSILALIVGRGNPVRSHGMSHWNAEIEIPVTVLEKLAACSRDELQEYVEVLEHFDMLRLRYEEGDFEARPRYVVGESTPGIGWPLLQDIHRFTACDPSRLRRILCDLDFSLLDLADGR